MRILPNRFPVGGLPALVAAMSLACTPRAYSQSPAPQVSERVSSFLQARSQPPPLSRTALGGEQPASVEIRGAVERPGQVKLIPGIETLQEALRAAGGLTADAVALRVLPGDESLGKLFAETADGATAVELPVAELTAGPIYLWSGDAVEVLSARATVATPQALEAAASGGSPAVANAGPSGDVAQGQPPAGVLAAEAAESTPPVASVSAEEARTGAPERVAPDAVLAEIRDQIAALRDLVETQNNALRSEIAQVRGEQAKLRASFERDARTRGTAPAPLPAARASEETISVAEHSPGRTTGAPARSASVAQTDAGAPPSGGRAGSAAPATVIVSGSVKEPGVYTVVDVKTVAGAVSAAGRRDDADLNAVEIRPEDQGSALLGIGIGLGGHSNKRIVDLTAVASGTTPDPPLRGGEVIFVPATRR
jgi:protein involved in polysaccharide export with SLBB domain